MRRLPWRTKAANVQLFYGDRRKMFMARAGRHVDYLFVLKIIFVKKESVCVGYGRKVSSVANSGTG
jgi:hypothetical protein